MQPNEEVVDPPFESTAMSTKGIVNENVIGDQMTTMNDENLNDATLFDMDPETNKLIPKKASSETSKNASEKSPSMEESN